MFVQCVFYGMWILVGDERTSGIFLEVQLLVNIILSAQVEFKQLFSILYHAHDCNKLGA
jgi:hypothetical protein